MAHRCCTEVLPANSARLFRHPAPILHLRAAQKLIRGRRGDRAIEYGGGCLRNARYLRRLGLTVTVVDLPEVRERFSRQYRDFEQRGGRFVAFGSPGHPTEGGTGYALGVITYVIETICDPRLREQLLRDCHRRLAPGGALILSVRGVSDVVTARARGVRCSDGYLTPLRTFVRAYDRNSLERLLRKVGFTDTMFLHRADSRTPELLHVIARTSP